MEGGVASLLTRTTANGRGTLDNKSYTSHTHTLAYSLYIHLHTSLQSHPSSFSTVTLPLQDPRPRVEEGPLPTGSSTVRGDRVDGQDCAVPAKGPSHLLQHICAPGPRTHGAHSHHSTGHSHHSTGHSHHSTAHLHHSTGHSLHTHTTALHTYTTALDTHCTLTPQHCGH